MKILYGVQGTGNGHTTRARAIAAELRKLPVEVDYLFTGRPRDQYFDMDIFGDYRVLDGLTFITGDGKIRPLQTLLNSKPWQFIRDVKSLQLDSYDLVITDFEPVTAWACKLKNKPVVGLGHQYAFLHTIPQHHGSPLQQLILRYFAPASRSLGLHWHHFDQPILPPVAPVAASPQEIQRRHYVVYLPFESIASITKLLKPFSAYHFSIYHPDAASGMEGHLTWHRPGRHTFQHDLHRCEGVLCNAGFELASEVLQLGRKLLVKPVNGQSEQYSNALAIDLLGYGHVMYELDGEKLREWLETACATRIRYPNVAAAICQWLVNGATGDIRELSAALWADTQLPDMTAATRTDNSKSIADATGHLHATR
jgi:uncharacterized protein (TIGR00661 family)